MAKKLALIKRLGLELSATTSDDEKERVYARLTYIAKQSTSKGFDEFYRTEVPRISGPYEDGELPENEDIQFGKDLAYVLKETILPLIPDERRRGENKREHAKKSHRALSTEFETLKKYVGGRRDGDSRT